MSGKVNFSLAIIRSHIKKVVLVFFFFERQTAMPEINTEQ